MLVVGLPLTIILGLVVATFLFPSLSFWEAALLAALLAPTDAALGQAVVSNPAVPLRIRQAINIESGLNDGIALPAVLLFAALAGVTIPLMLRRMGIDPALAGGVVLTTVTDVVGFGAFLGLGALFLT